MNGLNLEVGGIYDGINRPTESGRKSQDTRNGKKPVLNCRFPGDIYGYIDILAKGDGMTKTAVLMGIIREYREKHPERLRKARANIDKYGY